MVRKLVIGNWKLNGTLTGNAALLQTLAEGWKPRPGVEMVVCPPASYLFQAQQLLARAPLAWGAQDVSDQAGGAYTGEISANMLRDFGCRFCLVGHSERRTRFGETNALVAAKAAAALKAGLTPVVCVGETLTERNAGEALDVLELQVRALTSAIPARGLAGLALAYEPLWAIGTGQSADAATVQEVHGFLRTQLARADLAAAAEVPILYGGSVKAANASDYAAQRDVDGVLVGGASLVASEFLDIGAAFLARA